MLIFFLHDYHLNFRPLLLHMTGIFFFYYFYIQRDPFMFSILKAEPIWVTLNWIKPILTVYLQKLVKWPKYKSSFFFQKSLYSTS